MCQQGFRIASAVLSHWRGFEHLVRPSLVLAEFAVSQAVKVAGAITKLDWRPTRMRGSHRRQGTDGKGCPVAILDGCPGSAAARRVVARRLKVGTG